MYISRTVHSRHHQQISTEIIIHGSDSFFQFPYERKTTKPILCGISGLCKSIGFEIALMCDIRIVEEDATFGFTNPDLCIPHMANGPRMCADLIGRLETINLLLTPSKIIDCNEASRLGLVYGDAVANGTCKSSFKFD